MQALVAARGLAFDIALMGGEARGLGDTPQRLILLLKNREARRRSTAGNLNILAGGEVSVAAGLEAMLARLQQDAAGAFEHVNEILVGARVARAFAVPFQRD